MNFLSDENKDQTEEINRILFINHPMNAEFKEHLKIPYNFYIEGFDDLSELLKARGFKQLEDSTKKKIYQFSRKSSTKIHTLSIYNPCLKRREIKVHSNSDWKEDI